MSKLTDLIDKVNEVKNNKKLNEISSEPVDISWIYQKDSEWFGSFDVDGHEYDISFIREDKRLHINGVKIVSCKFAKPSKVDPHAFSFDFNKPLVVANTVTNAIKGYLQSEIIDVFIVKAYTKETSRVNKYRTFMNMLRYQFGFHTDTEQVHKSYTYFAIFRSVKMWQQKDEIINKLVEAGY